LLAALKHLARAAARRRRDGQRGPAGTDLDGPAEGSQGSIEAAGEGRPGRPGRDRRGDRRRGGVPVLGARVLRHGSVPAGGTAGSPAPGDG
jgi:hypothetical protein